MRRQRSDQARSRQGRSSLGSACELKKRSEPAHLLKTLPRRRVRAKERTKRARASTEKAGLDGGFAVGKRAGGRVAGAEHGGVPREPAAVRGGGFHGTSRGDLHQGETMEKLCYYSFSYSYHWSSYYY